MFIQTKNWSKKHRNEIQRYVNTALYVTQKSLYLEYSEAPQTQQSPKQKIKKISNKNIVSQIDLHQDINTSLKTTKQTQVLVIQHRKRVASEIQLQNVTLNDYDQIYNKKKQQLIEEQDRINQEQCTFNPQINDIQVKSKYLQSKPQKINNQENQSQTDIIQFNPNTIKTKLVQMKPVNSNGSIERMIKEEFKDN